MPHFLDIRVNGIAPLLSVKASKNFVLLRVVASRPARGDRGGVRYGFNRVGGAIITKGCCVVKNKGETRFSLLVGLTNPHRIRAPTVDSLSSSHFWALWPHKDGRARAFAKGYLVSAARSHISDRKAVKRKHAPATT